MSRASSKRQRLHLFRRGNDRCPICLTPFIEAEVEQGQTVTLEHVPARAFRAGGTAMCLTCRPCNLNTSRAEHAAVEAQRDEQKVQLRIPGLPTQTAYVSKGEGATFHLRMTKTRVPRTVLLSQALRSQEFDLTASQPSAHCANVPWLKAAYLSVVSLLGPLGYRYAEGAALEPVRQQIMQPGKEIIRHCVISFPTGWTMKDGILMNRAQVPCWVVKLGGHVVFLPRSWDPEFYEWIDELAAAATSDGDMTCTVGGGPLWDLAKFGHRRLATITCPQGQSPRAILGEDLFGAAAEGTDGDRVIPLVFADYSGQEVTALVMQRPWRTEAWRGCTSCA